MSTDSELFAYATDPDGEPEQQVDPASPAEPAGDSPEPQTQTPSQARDVLGRFAATPEQPSPTERPAEPENNQAPDVQPQEQVRQQEKGHTVSLSELLKEREKRQTEQEQRQSFERELAAERLARERLERELADFRKPQEPKQPVDFLDDPNGYVESLERRFEERQRQLEGNMSLRFAHRQYGKEFETAFESLVQAGKSGDAAAVQGVLSSPDAGEALMNWHRHRAMLDRTGGDLDGFLKKYEEELLSNDSFMARVAEHLRGQAGQSQSGARPSSIQLPPSLSRVASVAPQAEQVRDSVSDAELFQHATHR